MLPNVAAAVRSGRHGHGSAVLTAQTGARLTVRSGPHCRQPEDSVTLGVVPSAHHLLNSRDHKDAPLARPWSADGGMIGQGAVGRV